MAAPFGRSGDKLVGLIRAQVSAFLGDFRLFAGRDRYLHGSNPLIWHLLLLLDHTTVSAKWANCRKSEDHNP
jgi:hypothetical protein